MCGVVGEASRVGAEVVNGADLAHFTFVQIA